MKKRSLMKLQIRPAQVREFLYLYPQPHQELILATGAIGCFSGSVEGEDLATDRHWQTYRHVWITKDFMDEAQQVFNYLTSNQECGAFLSRQDAVEGFILCNHGEGNISRFNQQTNEYGFRVDTQNHTFMIHLVVDLNAPPNVYIYMYQRSLLESHIERASQGICFPSATISDWEAFHIEDGDSIALNYGSGPLSECGFVMKECRFITDSFICVGGEPWVTETLVKEYHKKGITIFPVRGSLPKVCYWFREEAGSLWELHRGEIGALLSPLNEPEAPEKNRKLADDLNKAMGITKAHEECMWWGCMNSWAEPNADPAYYNEDGSIK